MGYNFYFFVNPEELVVINVHLDFRTLKSNVTSVSLHMMSSLYHKMHLSDDGIIYEMISIYKSFWFISPVILCWLSKHSRNLSSVIVNLCSNKETVWKNKTKQNCKWLVHPSDKFMWVSHFMTSSYLINLWILV
jgi:hypothetical protein